MATITAKSGNGLLGTLGGLATIGGALIPGAQWLTPLGMGLGMLGGGGAGNGQGGGSGNSLLDMLTRLGTQLGGGSISGKNTQQQQPQLRGSNTDAELIKQWGTNPYSNGIYGLGGFNSWLR